MTLLAVLAAIVTGCTSSAAAGGMNAGWTVVVAAPDAVYSVLATGKVVSLDLQEGAELWHYPPETQQPSGIGALFSRRDPNAPQPLGATFGEPVIVGDSLVIGSRDGKLRAFGTQDGTLLWELALDGGVVGGLTVADGIAYVGTDEGLLYAVDVATQAFVWAEPFVADGWVWAAPVVDSANVYIGTMGKKAYALDRGSGKPLWAFETTGAIPGGVTLANGAVYFGTVDRQVFALDAQTGQPKWQQPVGHWVMGKPLVLDHTVYVASLDGNVHALREEDGSDRWEPVSLQRAVRAGPQAFGNDAVAVATESGELWRLDAATGKRARLYPEVGEIGQDTGFGAILSVPAVGDGWIVIGTAQGYVIALDVSDTGATERWMYSTN